MGPTIFLGTSIHVIELDQRLRTWGGGRPIDDSMRIAADAQTNANLIVTAWVRKTAGLGNLSLDLQIFHTSTVPCRSAVEFSTKHRQLEKN